MKKEDFFEVLGELDECIVQDAGAKKRRGRPAKIAAAAILFLAIGAGLGAGLGSQRNMFPDQLGSQAGGSGHDGGSLFMSYAGPLLPMTALEGGEGITARRALTYDFSLWSTRSSTDLLVTDAYTLTNPTSEEKTVTLLYPFASSLWELRENMPTLTADGAILQPLLHAGGYTGRYTGGWNDDDSDGFPSAADEDGKLDLSWLESWEHYRALLADGRYQAHALEAFPDLSSVPVIVYRFTDAVGPEADDQAGIPNPSIQAEFRLDYAKTTILSYGFNGASLDREAGVMIQEFSIPRPGDPRYGRPCYLFVVGDDIRGLTTGGYVTGGADPDTQALPECDVQVERYETDLDSALRQAAEWMYHSMTYDDETFAGAANGAGTEFELYFGLLKEFLLSGGTLTESETGQRDTGWIWDTNVEHMNRVFYLETAVTIPAGGSVTIEAQMTRKASYDFYCANTQNQGVYGFDLAARLGSTLCFTQQTAETVQTDSVEFVRQNYGFDLAGGVTKVTLDPASEHYYLEVRRKKAE